MRFLLTLGGLIVVAGSHLSSGDEVMVTGRPTPGPRPGDVYKEFSRHNGGDVNWRVTDDRAVDEFPAAADHLPNPTLPIEIDDLEHAVRAEVLVDRWGGHRGTTNKRIRFNDGRWTVLPEIGREGYGHIEDGIRGEDLMYQDNPVVEIPLEDLREGVNEVVADCDEEGGFGWGQWGLYSVVVRVYYDAAAKGDLAAIDGRFVSPRPGETIGENPTIRVEADCEMGTSRIDVLAAYEGFDEDGDGVHGGFHASRFQYVSGEPNEIRDHVGTLWSEPYELVWDTTMVPDQEADAIRLVARIQNSRGYWSVTDVSDGLSLRRDGSVGIYHAGGVPADFSVRVGETKTCVIELPDDAPLDRATDAWLHLRTWHGWDGHHEPIRINDHEMPVGGKNHFYDYDRLRIPPSCLKAGENVFAMHSETHHHMLETLWPGPSITVRYAREAAADTEDDPADAVSIREDEYEDRPHFVVETGSATYWIDRRSGGVSRLIDRDGVDWVQFRMTPWDDYPAAAAGAFRGLPNAVFGGDIGGFGHPGWDVAESRRVGTRSIVATTENGWSLTYDFDRRGVDIEIDPGADPRPYWFLYEGPIAGRFAPGPQTIRTEVFDGGDDSLDYFAGRKLTANFSSASLSDPQSDYILALHHRTDRGGIDTASYLGNTEAGIDSDDGMVVLGFGRGPDGIDPKLTGRHRFRVEMKPKPTPFPWLTR